MLKQQQMISLGRQVIQKKEGGKGLKMGNLIGGINNHFFLPCLLLKLIKAVVKLYYEIT